MTTNNSQSEGWEEQFREYFDKTLKPKKPTMKNLDRELCVDFISKLITAAEQRGYQRGLNEKKQCPYGDCWKVKYRECPIHGIKPK